MKSPEVMSYQNFNETFLVYCDTSELGLGVVLYQEQEGQLKVIGYASRLLSLAPRFEMGSN